MNIFILAIKHFNDNSFSFNCLISPENRNLESLTIQYDVGHPVSNQCLIKLFTQYSLRRRIRYIKSLIRYFKIVNRSKGILLEMAEIMRIG